MPSDRRAISIGCAALAAGMLISGAGGCARSVTDRSVIDGRAGDTVGFWSDLEQRRVVTNHDALHGLLLSTDNADPHSTYEERLADAVARGWLPEGRNPITMPANESARMGDLAMAACKITDIKGGVTMRVFGLSPRYATRELISMEIIPERSEGQALTGLEFIEFASRVQDRLTTGGAKAPTLDERLSSPGGPNPPRTASPGPEGGETPAPKSENDNPAR